MNRLQMINTLQKQVPVLDSQAEKQAQAGNAIQLQSALGAAPKQANVTQAAQTLAPQATAQAAQTNLQSAAQTQNTMAGLGQSAVQAQAAQNQNQQQVTAQGQAEAQAKAQQDQQLKLAREQRKSNKKLTQKEIETADRLQSVGIYQENRLIDLSLDQRKQLEAIGGNVKDKIFDSRLQFEKTEAGRKFTNVRQLADFNATRAKDEIELKNRMREMTQAHEMKVQILTAAQDRIIQELDQMSRFKDQKLDFEQQKRLLQAKKDLEEELARAAADAKNTQMIFQGVGMVAGAVVGSMFMPGVGTAAGAAMGASMGAGVGSMTYGVAANEGMV